MFLRFATLGLLPALLCAFANADQAAPFTNCDKYAASDLGTSPAGAGVPFEKIDPKVSVPACEDAVRAYPHEPRLLFELGRSYWRGGNIAAALSRFQQAANLGYPPAMNAIGAMYSDGLGVPKDDAMAVVWYRKAALRGGVAGELSLGSAYENGRGVPKDYEVALGWYRKAAAQGSADAEDSIGNFYCHGMGVKQDGAEAATWFRRAAEKGMAGAQYNLAVMYEHGLGVAQNRVEAIAWFKKSADQGNEPAKKKLIELGRVGQPANVSYIAVTARGVSVVPGAIICPDYATVSQMFDLYTSHWEDEAQYVVTNGQSALVRGQPGSAPDLASYGCLLVPSGTPMTMERGNVVPVVTVRLSNGKTVRGVTLPAMASSQ